MKLFNYSIKFWLWILIIPIHWLIKVYSYNLGKTDEAVKYYDRALAIDPSDVEAQSNKDSALLSLSSLAKRNQNTSAIS